MDSAGMEPPIVAQGTAIQARVIRTLVVHRPTVNVGLSLREIRPVQVPNLGFVAQMRAIAAVHQTTVLLQTAIVELAEALLPRQVLPALVLPRHKPAPQQVRVLLVAQQP